ncbi:MAG: translation initiation factor 3, partial [bacterium]|nr:translation initiation factor 3 [bacterium]
TEATEATARAATEATEATARAATEATEATARVMTMDSAVGEVALEAASAATVNAANGGR